MDKRFLHKVVDQIMSETEIDYDMEVIYTPFSLTQLLLLFPAPSFSFSFPPFFSKHCKEVYGLNDEESEYVWDEYRDIIKDKIKNNG